MYTDNGHQEDDTQQWPAVKLPNTGMNRTVLVKYMMKN